MNQGVSKVTGRSYETAPGGREERAHKCAKCFNPFTRAGNPECPKAKEQSNEQ